jgi:hypothetical protein
MVAAMVTASGWGMAQPAQASRVYVDGDTLVIAAAPGEINALTVQGNASKYGTYVVADAGAIMTVGDGCVGSPVAAKVAVCTVPAGYDAALSLSLGDGPDVATVWAPVRDLEADGGAGDDLLSIPGASDGSTFVQLGGGNDTLDIEGSYGWDVQVYGGDGNDSIDASAQDGGWYYGEGGDDTITVGGWVSGGEGADTINSSGQGYGTYFGDGGDDVIDTDDSEFDRIDCGLGADALTHDAWDEFSGCETLG